MQKTEKNMTPPQKKKKKKKEKTTKYKDATTTKIAVCYAQFKNGP